MKYLLITTILLVGSQTLNSQGVYFTRGASIKMVGQLSGAPVVMNSHELNVTLDYESTDLTISFPLSSLESNNQLLDSITNESGQTVKFKGQLSLDHINTDNHPPLHFTVEGWCEYGDGSYRVVGTGELKHLGDTGHVACMMTMVLDLNLVELGIHEPVSGLHNEFKVYINQAILQKEID